MAAGIVYGQTSPQITVSTEKVKVNGEVMLVHKVKGGETLFSISRAYNVAIEEIVRRNESLKAGLKEGSTIYIPSAADRQTVPAPVKEARPAAGAPDMNSGKTGNTAASGKSWGKTLGERLKIGGLAGKKGKGGTVLPSGYDTKQYSKKKHTVKWYEKIEDVAAKYKVPVDAIVELNSLETTAIKKKQVLYIPNDAFLMLMAQNAVQEEDQPAQEAVAEEVGIVGDVAEEEVAGIAFDGNVDLTYILPLNLKDTLGPNSSFMDFYAGAMLAVEKLSHTGNKVTANIVDQLMFSSIEELVASGAVYGKKTIIGPVRPADIEKVLEATDGKGIVISPMDQNSERLADGNPSFYQAPPAAKAQQKGIAELLASRCTASGNAVLIYEASGADTALVRTAKETLAAKGIAFSTLSYGILEGREILGKMSGYMKPETENLVLVLSNSEAFVSDVVRNLNLICTNPVEENRRSITLFGLPRWRNFETIEVDYFHRMNLHLSLPYFVDYTRENVKDFLMKYRALYNSEPTPFAFQGYDVTMHAYEILRGNAASIQSGTLQMNGLYTNDAGNGHTNTGTRNIMYNNDYTISVIE